MGSAKKKKCQKVLIACCDNSHRKEIVRDWTGTYWNLIETYWNLIGLIETYWDLIETYWKVETRKIRYRYKADKKQKKTFKTFNLFWES